MEVGLSVTTMHPRDTDARTAARWVVERAAAARDAGFASFSVGDHHATPAHYLQNVPMLARCMAELGDMPVIPLFLLPLWHPVLLAEQIGTLAAIAEGPLHCILAVGEGAEQFAALGASVAERRGRMEEGLMLLHRLLHEDHVTHEGEYWRLEDVSVNPKPSTPPELWVGASARVAIKRAAQMGDAWLAAPGETPESASEKVAYYRELLHEPRHGRRVTGFPIRRDVYIGESDAEAEAVAGPILGRGYRGFERSALIVGGPETAIAALRDLEQRGFNHTLVRFLPVGQERILASIARLGREVIPAVRSDG